MRYSRISRFFVCLIVTLVLISSAAHAVTKADIPALIDQALADPALKHGLQGVLIRSLKDDAQLYERNSDLVFIPASNFKLIVSSASLDLLGPDYRMKTALRMTGEVSSKGVLTGDLILVGGGDPVLKRSDLQEMAAKVSRLLDGIPQDAGNALGVKLVIGNVIGDDTRFDDQRLGDGWCWDDEPYYYSAQISGLNLDENVVGVWVRPGAKEGDPAAVEVVPATKYMIVESTCITGAAGSEKHVWVNRERGKNVIRVSGSVPLDYKPTSREEAITMEEPTLFACASFIDLLKAEGIQVRGRAIIGKTPESARLVAEHESPPMSEMLRLLNKPSDNLIAECLLKNLGAAIKGKGTANAGADAEIEFLTKIGGDVTAVKINDASGLCRSDYVSPKNLVAILKYMYGHKDSKTFIDSLPIAGVDGTLRSRMKSTSAQGNVRAKTGYIGRVSSLSGYVTTTAGEPLVFSIMMNGHLCPNSSATAVQNKIAEALAGLED